METVLHPADRLRDSRVASIRAMLSRMERPHDPAFISEMFASGGGIRLSRDEFEDLLVYAVAKGKLVRTGDQYAAA